MSTQASGSRGAAAEVEPEANWHIISKLPVPYRTKDVYFRLEAPPAVSRLQICENYTPDFEFNSYKPPIIAAISTWRILFNVPASNDFLVYDARTGVTTLIPPTTGRCPLRASINVGLAEKTSRNDHFVIAQLSKPRPNSKYDLIVFDSLKAAWELHTLPRVDEHWPWNVDGVLFHDDSFWWTDARRGTMLVTKSFLAEGESATAKVFKIAPTTINPEIEARFVRAVRLFRVCDGAIRFLEISGVTMPVDGTKHIRPTPGTDPVLILRTFLPTTPRPGWQTSFSAGRSHINYVVKLQKLWEHPKYYAAGLQYGTVPSLGFFHPVKTHIVYIFVRRPEADVDLLPDDDDKEPSAALVAFDLRSKEVISVTDGNMRRDGKLDFQSSEYVDTWMVPSDVWAMNCVGLCGWGMPVTNAPPFDCGGACWVTRPMSMAHRMDKVGNPDIACLPAP